MCINWSTVHAHVPATMAAAPVESLSSSGIKTSTVYTSILNVYTYLFTESQALVRKSIQLVLTDGGFNIPSVPAQTTRKTVEKLLEWVSNSDNSSLFASFASDLIKQLESCFKSSYESFQRRREKMWEQLFKLRSSPRFKAMGSSFLLESIDVPACQTSQLETRAHSVIINIHLNKHEYC